MDEQGVFSTDMESLVESSYGSTQINIAELIGSKGYVTEVLHGQYRVAVVSTDLMEGVARCLEEILTEHRLKNTISEIYKEQ